MVSYHIEDGMHLCKFHRRNLWGLQPLTCIFASENGAFGCWGYWICDALELLLMQAISGRSDCCFAAAMVWECLFGLLLCCCHGLGMLSYLKGCLTFQCTDTMAANIFSSVLNQNMSL